MLDRAAMGLRVVFGRFAGVVCRMQPVSVRNVRVVGGFLMVALLVVFGGFAVVSRGMLVMFRGFFVMFRSFVVLHSHVLFLGEMFGRRRRCRLRGNSIKF
jgi:hypothetical protein